MSQFFHLQSRDQHTYLTRVPRASQEKVGMKLLWKLLSGGIWLTVPSLLFGSTDPEIPHMHKTQSPESWWLEGSGLEGSRAREF